jgi:hypothetical protein
MSGTHTSNKHQLWARPCQLALTRQRELQLPLGDRVLHLQLDSPQCKSLMPRYILVCGHISMIPTFIAAAFILSGWVCICSIDIRSSHPAIGRCTVQSGWLRLHCLLGAVPAIALPNRRLCLSSDGCRGTRGGECRRVAAGVLRIAPYGVPRPREVPPQLVPPPCSG